MDIKEESCFWDLCSENERDTKDLVKKVKIETVTSSSDIKPEVEDSTCSSQNEEHHLLRFNETIKESEFEAKIYIKEEHWCLQSEESDINNDIQDETHENCYSTKPPSPYKEEVSCFKSDLSYTGDLENDLSFNTNKDRPECASDRDCQGQKSVVTDMFSVETSVCLEASDQIVKQPHKCTICNKTFTKLSGFKRHILYHEGIKPHMCNICNKAFTELSDLKRHKLIHEGIKPHRCSICNQGFTKLSGFKRHILFHEGIKPHMCNICKKAFTELSDLKRHKLIHEGIKPHKCNICNQAFTDLSSLRRHKLIHEGKKPHKCNICNQAFTDLSTSRRHKLIHEGIKPHKCNICNKAFTQLSNLKRHLGIHRDQ